MGKNADSHLAARLSLTLQLTLEPVLRKEGGVPVVTIHEILSEKSGRGSMTSPKKNPSALGSPQLKLPSLLKCKYTWEAERRGQEKLRFIEHLLLDMSLNI